METINDNIRQLMEMLDNPEAYTEQEILDIINHDEDTRETYRMMVEAKRSSRRHHSEKPVDVDAAWQRISEKMRMKNEESLADDLTTADRACSDIPKVSRSTSPFTRHSSLTKIAASFIGVLLVSGIAFAAIQIVRHAQQNSPKAEEVISTSKPTSIALADTLTTDTISAPQPIIYDNIPLEKMLPEIAEHYQAKVMFVNNEARQLRFRFVWNPKKGLDQVVSDLNQFERLNVTLKDSQITVE